MARNRDPRDTDEISTECDADDRDALAELRREQRRIDAKVRQLEAWRAVLDGLPGHPGSFAQLTAKNAELEVEIEKDRAAMKADMAKLNERVSSQDRVIDRVERAYWKIIVSGTIAGSMTGAVVAVVLKYIG